MVAEAVGGSSGESSKGFFSKVVGKGIEIVGGVFGSEKLQEKGRNMQGKTEKQVEATSNEVAQWNPYDMYTSSVSETQRINEVLAEFSLNLSEECDELENLAIKESRAYFDIFIEQLEEVNKNPALKINIKKIKREINSVIKSIKGSFKKHLAKRVSLDDDQCLAILELESGSHKEAKMKNFGKKVVSEALRELTKNIKTIIKEQQEYIEEEINEQLDVILLNLEQMSKSMQELEELKNSNSNELEEQKADIITKIAILDELDELLV